ncbi:MAG: dephospho-CoA kinase [Gammaproteobacteria bacterium TMED226]|nr:MAG: dephospho-CoA kinase [Gammaproteobacteria bacterium TMED226]|tara:strand:- start:7311 stop:7904 length:594 start_codon:yes stop_codon:yes gene_type:complete
MIVGLTGGIGSGKSVAGKYFNELGIDIIDADDISRSILDDNKKARKLFLNNFGDKFLNNNKIDRNLLRSEIFKNPDKKHILESIIHPIVREELSKFIEQSKSIYKIIMVPLIFETSSKDFYNKIIVVDCDQEHQIDRASLRDNKSEKDIENIIKNQATRDQRLSIADEIIINNSTLDNLKTQVIRVHQKLLGININE